MQQRMLGDASVTAIGIGDVDLAIAGARGIALADVERAVHHALELGITLVEVTDEERAERLCGDAVRALRLRDRAIVATRIRALDARPGRPRDVLPERLPARYVQDRVEAALRATRLDALPLVQLPIRTVWTASKAWPEFAGTCARLTREGKVMRWAARLDLDAAERDDRLGDELREAAALREPFVALSVAYSACDRRADALFREPAAERPDELRAPPPDLLAVALAMGPAVAGQIVTPPPSLLEAPAAPPKPLPVLAREPLAGGTLAGAIGPGIKLPPRDDRNALDAATLERIAIAMARLSELVRRPPAAASSSDAARAELERLRTSKVEREATTVAELALRYVTARAIALPRLHRREHLAEALAVLAAPPLSDELRARLEHALR